MRRFAFILLTVFALVVCLQSVAQEPSGAKTEKAAKLLNPKSPDMNKEAPPKYLAKFSTSKGDFTIEVNRSWAPRGADRFYHLVRAGFYDGQRLFRVVPGFVVQWGISGSPEVSRAWQNATIPDDPVRHSNTPGTISFATAGPNTRTTQVFVNLGRNPALDTQGFAPFGLVTSGMGVIAKLYHGYGEKPSSAQPQIAAQGEAFLGKAFPKLDTILKARIVS